MDAKVDHNRKLETVLKAEKGKERSARIRSVCIRKESVRLIREERQVDPEGKGHQQAHG